MSDRTFGDLRIFQAVFNDLNMKHEVVTREDGTRAYAYTYKGTDPYELEDGALPKTVELIRKAERAAEERLLDELEKNLPEEKQVKHVLNAQEHGEIYKQRMYRYGGFDFAIRLVRESIAAKRQALKGKEEK